MEVFEDSELTAIFSDQLSIDISGMNKENKVIVVIFTKEDAHVDARGIRCKQFLAVKKDQKNPELTTVLACQGMKLCDIENYFNKAVKLIKGV